LYAASGAWGVALVFTRHAGLYFLLALFMASTATWWTVSDARQRGHSILHILQLFVFVFWGIAVPIYLTWSRGLRGVGWTLLHAFGLTVTFYLAFYVTVFSVYGLDAFSPQP
jgi:hypothetical protein